MADENIDNAAPAATEQTAAPATEQVAAADTDTVLTSDQSQESSTTEDVLLDADKSDDDSSGEVKTEEATATSEAPDTYADFDLPEGFGINPDYMAHLAPALKELGMSQEAAQKLITAHVNGVQASEGARVNAFTKLKQDWLDQAKTDATIGGDKWDTTVKHARAALKEFGSPELNGLLKDYGIGNNPEILRIFSKVGALLQEDKIGNVDGKIVPEKDLVSRMYPNN